MRQAMFMSEQDFEGTHRFEDPVSKTTVGIILGDENLLGYSGVFWQNSTFEALWWAADGNCTVVLGIEVVGQRLRCRSVNGIGTGQTNLCEVRSDALKMASCRVKLVERNSGKCFKTHKRVRHEKLSKK
jgi:hypothetical protein